MPNKKHKDISNERFGRLVAISMIAKFKNKTKWICLCDCGKIKEILLNSLTTGRTMSCGCLQKDCVVEYNSKRIPHKMIRTSTYGSWLAMNRRCNCENATGYKNYGGRGIKICKRWKKFDNFYKDMGERPIGKTLDRINNNGNYKPSNCRWATYKQQSNNTRRNKNVISESK